MSFAGPPAEHLSSAQFYSQALNESDAGKRRRLFADARASNPGSYELWVKAAEVEEHWGADEGKLKSLVIRGVTAFKNPAGHEHQDSSSLSGPITRETWLDEAVKAKQGGKSKTAVAIEQAVDEAL
ncbi:hypothetical protein DFQ27_001700 [Actinomortierella ambigua]|uniref:Uncharacterized protein n=1 Tax=Actinomortierella ambigua TaxID=1343610 RepID=A0A9P6U780_9FUNG|nr:hypothetical protein DFQ26_001240 [Actinomortierella ambigua]KAG0263540.1 hypothetical protein DFQ27_001700 [Actinomortierella ambigua]